VVVERPNTPFPPPFTYLSAPSFFFFFLHFFFIFSSFFLHFFFFFLVLLLLHEKKARKILGRRISLRKMTTPKVLTGLVMAILLVCFIAPTSGQVPSLDHLFHFSLFSPSLRPLSPRNPLNYEEKASLIHRNGERGEISLLKI